MKYLLLVVISILVQPLMGQTNLVPNPSFEDTIGCPEFTGEIWKAAGWTAYHESPDFYHNCASDGMSYFGVPHNTLGFQYSYEGNAYMGLGNYFKTLPETREHVGVALTSTLNVSQKYYVSFMVSLADTTSYDCPSSKIGARLSTIAFNYVTNPSPVDNFAHVYTNSIITDQNNWTRVFGSFVADSAYSYLIIGNFFDDNNTDTIDCSYPTSSVSYLYIDAVCVSSDSAFAQNYLSATTIQHENEIVLFPNPVTDYLTIVLESADSFEYLLTDLMGKKILSGDLSPSRQINLAYLAKGTYILNLYSKDQSMVKKIVKS